MNRLPASARTDDRFAAAAGLLSRAARTFSLATGIPCRAVDPAGRSVDGEGEALCCGLCDAVREACTEDGRAGHEDPAAGESPRDGRERATETSGTVDQDGPVCDEVVRYGILQAERFGGAYLSFCPNSLLITTAAVRREAELAGALLAGPALLVDREELASEELAGMHGSGASGKPSLMERLARFPSVDTARAKALADLLEAIARDTGAELEGRVDPKLEASRRNAQIAEYIQSLKSAGIAADPEGDPLRGYPFGKEKELVALVARGDRAGARRILNEILGAVFFEGGGALRGVRARALELVVLLSRAAVEGGATEQEVFGASEDFIKRTASAKTPEDIATWLAVVLNRFTDFVFTLKKAKHADMIRKAERFIKARYREELTLEAVAAEVGLSTSYFSTVFKQEVGTGFAAYLNEIRIHRAKELLRNRSIPIVEVAGMVGFLDQSYFSRVFKAIVGVSPGAFRNGKFVPEGNIEIHGEA